jgi:hypothetical protein
LQLVAEAVELLMAVIRVQITDLVAVAVVLVTQIATP